MIRTILIAAAALSLAACASTQAPEPIVRVIETKVPVAVSCVPASLGDEPAYVDTSETLRAAAGPEDRFQMIAAGRIQRDAWLAKVRPVLKACRTP
jgi:type IV pilus biogenesis protein CpaD/CtpE